MRLGRLQIRMLGKGAEDLRIYRIVDIKLPEHYTQMEMRLEDFKRFADEYGFIVYEAPDRFLCIDDKADVIFWAKKETKEEKKEGSE